MLVIEKSNIKKAAYRISFNKDSKGGIGFTKKSMVCNYFKENKDKLELLEVIKKDDKTIYYCKNLDTSFNNISKNFLELEYKQTMIKELFDFIYIEFKDYENVEKIITKNNRVIIRTKKNAISVGTNFDVLIVSYSLPRKSKRLNFNDIDILLYGLKDLLKNQ